MFEIEIPIRLVSESNTHEHWTKSRKRHQIQKNTITFVLRQCEVKPPCKITLTRIAPRMLDSHDNLATSFKWVIDAIAASLTGDNRPGRADGHSGLFFAYNQEKRGVREYALNIRIESTYSSALIYRPPKESDLKNPNQEMKETYLNSLSFTDDSFLINSSEEDLD